MPFWKIARDFIDKFMFSEDKEIVYTGFVLKEPMFQINNKREYKDIFELLNNLILAEKSLKS